VRRRAHRPARRRLDAPRSPRPRRHVLRPRRSPPVPAAGRPGPRRRRAKGGSMEYHEAVRRLERGEPAPLYLVTGTEGYLVRSFLDRLRSLAGEPTLNVQVFDAADHSLQAVLEAARQLPMFGSRRVVVAAADPWLGGGRGSLGAGDLADLEAYAADPTPSPTLVVVAAEPDRR